VSVTVTVTAIYTDGVLFLYIKEDGLLKVKAAFTCSVNLPIFVLPFVVMISHGLGSR
jgi:hypothetical protein